jgi:hypothetical protein
MNYLSFYCLIIRAHQQGVDKTFPFLWDGTGRREDVAFEALQKAMPDQSTETLLQWIKDKNVNISKPFKFADLPVISYGYSLPTLEIPFTLGEKFTDSANMGQTKGVLRISINDDIAISLGGFETADGGDGAEIAALEMSDGHPRLFVWNDSADDEPLAIDFENARMKE